jgi:hypothetical protein
MNRSEELLREIELIQAGKKRPPYPYGIQARGGARKIPWLSAFGAWISAVGSERAVRETFEAPMEPAWGPLGHWLAANYRLPERWEWC